MASEAIRTWDGYNARRLAEAEEWLDEMAHAEATDEDDPQPDGNYNRIKWKLSDLRAENARMREALRQGPHVSISDDGNTACIEWILPESRAVIWIGEEPSWSYADKTSNSPAYGALAIPPDVLRAASENAELRELLLETVDLVDNLDNDVVPLRLRLRIDAAISPAKEGG